MLQRARVLKRGYIFSNFANYQPSVSAMQTCRNQSSPPEGQLRSSARLQLVWDLAGVLWDSGKAGLSQHLPTCRGVCLQQSCGSFQQYFELNKSRFSHGNPCPSQWAHVAQVQQSRWGWSNRRSPRVLQNPSAMFLCCVCLFCHRLDSVQRGSLNGQPPQLKIRVLVAWEKVRICRAALWKGTHNIKQHGTTYPTAVGAGAAHVLCPPHRHSQSFLCVTPLFICGLWNSFHCNC